MTGSDATDARDEAAAPAATVLYEPDAAVLARLLDALDRDDRRLFVYVNGAVGSDVERRLSDLSNAVLLRAADNQGLGEALNAVCAAAEGEGHAHLILFDQDSEPAPDLPERLRRRFREIEAGGIRLAALGPLAVPPEGEGFRPLDYHWRSRETGTVEFLPTSGSLVSLQAWRATGPFRADYFVGGIDVEWGFRAWAAGFASQVARDVAMPHRWGTSDDDGRPQILRQPDWRNRLYIRNAVDCLRLRHVPIAWKLRFGVRLAAQIVLLLASRLRDGSAWRLVARALSDGWHGRLGPPDKPAGRR